MPISTAPIRERAFLVGVEIDEDRGFLSLEDSLLELARLADTAGLDVVGQATQRLHSPDPRTYLGSGKVEEIRDLVEEMLADVVLFDEELSPRHQRELEKVFKDEVRILDRTALILDIFAQHAHTREGALQVELAQYQYRLPRLTRAWTHLARQAGGGGGQAGSVGGVGLRGPGETQLEVDRQEIGRRIAHLRREIEKVRAHRSRYRSQRRKAALPTVALIGYTNAGKSTLLNRLSGAEVYVADQLFATLDPTSRRILLPGGRQVLVTDTVGFIQKLPTTLVAAFRATLEEISEADCLLHVIDVTHPSAADQARAVLATLEEIGASEIPGLTALNKIDLLAAPELPVEWIDEYERAIPVSAVTGEGVEALLVAIEQQLFEAMVPVSALIPYDQGRLVNLIHEQGHLERSRATSRGVNVEARVPSHLLDVFRPYLRRGKRRAPTDGGMANDSP
jgi:GTP-binding protein HflX